MSNARKVVNVYVFGEAMIAGGVNEVGKAVQSAMAKSVHPQAWRNYPYSTGGGH